MGALLSNLLFWTYVILRGVLPWALLMVLILFWVGRNRNWKWVRNPFVRSVHLVLSFFLLIDIWSVPFGLEKNVTDQATNFLVLNTPQNLSIHTLIFSNNITYLGHQLCPPIFFYSILFLATLITFYLVPPWWRVRRAHAADNQP